MISRESRIGIAVLLLLTLVVFFLPYIQISSWGWDFETESYSFKDILVSLETARSVTKELGRDPDLTLLKYLPFLFGLIIAMPLVGAVALFVGRSKKLCWFGLAAGVLIVVSHGGFLIYQICNIDYFKYSEVSVGWGLYVNLALGFLTIICSTLVLCAPGQKRPSRVSGAKMGLLVGRAGMYSGETIDIPAGEEIIIGRDSALSHIVLDRDSEKVSRKHCGIVYAEGTNSYVVTDYSTNGTFVDGGNRLVANIPTSLPGGTVILLGNKDNSFLLK